MHTAASSNGTPLLGEGENRWATAAEIGGMLRREKDLVTAGLVACYLAATY